MVRVIIRRVVVGLVQMQHVGGGYRKLSGAWRLGLCRRNALGVVIVNLVARGGYIGAGRYRREGMLALLYNGFVNLWGCLLHDVKVTVFGSH